jgi:hypothetical protein
MLFLGTSAFILDDAADGLSDAVITLDRLGKYYGFIVGSDSVIIVEDTVDALSFAHFRHLG